MKAVLIVLLLQKKKNFSVLRDFAQGIRNKLSGHPVYTSPNLSLPAFQTHITALDKAITKWGLKGNRGSHADHVKLVEAAEVVKKDLRQLSRYCMTTTPNDALNFASVGWQTKHSSNPLGSLPGPSNLRVVRRKAVVPGLIHYCWKKVTGAKAYNVWTGTGNIIAQPPPSHMPYQTVTAATFDDMPVQRGTIRWIVVGCVGANPNTGYTGLAGQVTP